MTAPEVVAVERWVAARLPSSVAHLDVAAAGRVSEAVLAAQTAHLREEARVGAYVAHDRAGRVLEQARADAGALFGLSGADVAFSDGAGTAFATLIAGWPLGRGARVGTAGSEYGPNAYALQRVAAERGWRLVDLPVDVLGRVVEVPAGLELVTFPQVASQRGVVQPVADVLATGVPLVLDVAQALGQAAVPSGCAAYVATSRKWLCGPRGVGLLAVDPAVVDGLAPQVQPLAGATGAARHDVHEAHVAGRVGLAVALREWEPAVVASAQFLAAHARRVLGVGGWSVVEPVDEPTALTTLVPPAGVDPVAVRAGLLEAGLLVSAVPASRAADLDGPVLRVSTAAWARTDELDRLAEHLGRAFA